MHDGSNLRELQWACGVTGPVYANAEMDNTDQKFVCYGCNNPLDFVNGHKRRRLGTEFMVRAFYRHRGTGNVGGCGSSESMHHKAAKDAVVKYRNKLRYHYVCQDCKRSIPLKIPLADDCDAREEVPWSCPQGKRYQLDVGMLDKNAAVIGAVEIYHSHPVGRIKADALNSGNLDWCEVRAKQVLDAVQHQTWSIQVVQCGFDICCECVEKIRAEEFRRLDNELLIEMTQRSDMRDQRKEMITRAKDEWFKLKGIPIDEEEGKWTELKRRVLCTIVQQATKECTDIDDDEVANEIDKRMDRDVVTLTFGKYKFHTLDEVSVNDWSYVLWLAGYDFGKLDDRCRPLKRRSNGIGTNFITEVVERAARDIVTGRCFGCATHMPSEQPSWKHIRGQCYSKHKRGLQ